MTVRPSALLDQRPRKAPGAPLRAVPVDRSPMGPASPRELRLARLRAQVARGEYVLDADALSTAITRRLAFTAAITGLLTLDG